MKKSSESNIQPLVGIKPEIICKREGQTLTLTIRLASRLSLVQEDNESESSSGSAQKRTSESKTITKSATKDGKVTPTKSRLSRTPSLGRRGSKGNQQVTNKTKRRSSSLEEALLSNPAFLNSIAKAIAAENTESSQQALGQENLESLPFAKPSRVNVLDSAAYICLPFSSSKQLLEKNSDGSTNPQCPVGCMPIPPPTPIPPTLTPVSDFEVERKPQPFLEQTKISKPRTSLDSNPPEATSTNSIKSNVPIAKRLSTESNSSSKSAKDSENDFPTWPEPNADNDEQVSVALDLVQNLVEDLVQPITPPLGQEDREELLSKVRQHPTVEQSSSEIKTASVSIVTNISTVTKQSEHEIEKIHRIESTIHVKRPISQNTQALNNANAAQSRPISGSNDAQSKPILGSDECQCSINSEFGCVCTDEAELEENKQIAENSEPILESNDAQSRPIFGPDECECPINFEFGCACSDDEAEIGEDTQIAENSGSNRSSADLSNCLCTPQCPCGADEYQKKCSCDEPNDCTAEELKCEPEKDGLEESNEEASPEDKVVTVPENCDSDLEGDCVFDNDVVETPCLCTPECVCVEEEEDQKNETLEEIVPETIPFQSKSAPGSTSRNDSTGSIQQGGAKEVVSPKTGTGPAQSKQQAKPVQQTDPVRSKESYEYPDDECVDEDGEAGGTGAFASFEESEVDLADCVKVVLVDAGTCTDRWQPQSTKAQPLRSPQPTKSKRSDGCSQTEQVKCPVPLQSANQTSKRTTQQQTPKTIDTSSSATCFEDDLPYYPPPPPSCEYHRPIQVHHNHYINPHSHQRRFYSRPPQIFFPPPPHHYCPSPPPPPCPPAPPNPTKCWNNPHCNTANKK